MRKFTGLKTQHFICLLLTIAYLASAKATVNSVTPDSSFITTWKTNYPGISDSMSITIPVHPTATYNYDVDWDNDGIYDTFGVDTAITHNFAVPGTYTIRIKGDYKHLYFKDADDAEKIIDVIQWGNIQWNSLHSGFKACKNLNISASDAPDLTNVTSLTDMFFGCTSFNSPLEHWDVSKIESFYFTFGNCTNFNQPLNNWDVSSATNMQRMFIGCTNFNQPLDQWDVSKVRSFSAMFNNATHFNQDIGNWEVSSGVYFGLMFDGATNFNQDIGDWNTINMATCKAMFHKASSFNQDISRWNVSKVSNFSSMFKNAVAFNQNLNDWDVSNATNMNWMFAAATSFNQPLDQWEVDKVEVMTYLFFYASSFNQDISGWNVSNVTSMQNMFKGPNMTFNQDIGNWEVSQVTDMRAMFEANPSFDQNLGNWDVRNLTHADRMFHLTKLSTPNYDSLLIGWNNLELQDSVSFHAGTSIYCAGWAARANMIDNRAWQITDAGAEQDTPIALCKDTTLYLAASGNLVIDASILDNGSFDACTPVSLFTQQTQFDCNDLGIRSDTLLVMDQNGNQSTCIATLTIADPPFSFNCPTDITVSTNANNCQAQVFWESPQARCNTLISSNYNSGDIFPIGSTIVSYSIMDGISGTWDCSFTVTVINTLAIKIDSLGHTPCLDDASGSAFISVSGGSPPYSFDWDHSSANTPSDIEDPMDLRAGINRVTVTDRFGCSRIDSVELRPTSINISNCPSNIIVIANHDECSAIVTWDEPIETCSAASLIPDFSSGAIFELGTTTVTYTASNAFGASATCSFEVTVENNLEITPEQISSPSCADAADGQISIVLNGGAAPYRLDWNHDGLGDFDDLNNIENLSDGNYTLDVIDANGCTSYATIELSSPEKLEVLVETLEDLSCTDTPDGTIAISVIGGTAPYQLDWSNDGLGDFDDPALLSGLLAGSHVLELFDQQGCRYRDTFILQQPEPLVLSATFDTLVSTDEIFIDLAIQGGVPPYRFDWNTDESEDYNDTEDIQINSDGIYTVTVMDDRACLSTLEIALEIPTTGCQHQFFNLYPNPNNGVFTLELASCETPTLIEVFDAVGREVYNQTTIGAVNLITLKDLSGDAYFLRINTEKESFIKPFTIVHE